MDKKQIFSFILIAVAAVLMYRMWSQRSQQTGPSVVEMPRAQEVESGRVPVNVGYRLVGDPMRFDDQGRPVSIDDEAAEPTEVPMPRLGSLDPDGPFHYQIEIDPRGGGIYSLQLTGIFDTVEHKNADDKTGEQLQQWSYRLLSPVESLGQTWVPFATQRIALDEGVDRRISMLEEGEVVYPQAAAGPKFTQDTGWEIGQVVTAEDGTQSVDVSAVLARIEAVTTEEEDGSVTHNQTVTNLIRLTKTYIVRPGSYSFELALRVENLTGQDQVVRLEQLGATGVPREDLRSDMRSVAYGQIKPGTEEPEVPRKFDARGLANQAIGTTEVLGGNHDGQRVLWASFGNKFFGCTMYPIPPGLDRSAIHQNTPLEELAIQPDQPGEYGFRFLRRVLQGEGEIEPTQMTLMHNDGLRIAPGASRELRFDVFAGPKSKGLFDDVPLYARLNYEDSIELGGSCGICTWAPLTYLVMGIIEKGGAWIGNYGVMIILLVLVIRLALHPITKRSQMSMMKLGKLGPEMERIKEKHADDKDAQQKAMMEFMRKQGASPILGCLPMFLQMPIWIALWTGLRAVPALRHEGLLPVWINDLASPDALIPFGASLNIPLLSQMVGPISSFNLLPLLLAVFMFLQQKLMPMATSAASASPDQKAQQKMMQIMMTVMFLLIFYNAPSGLTLYVMASMAGGVLDSLLVRRHIARKEAAEAAAVGGETIVAAPGKAPRSKRPKKPKGPKSFY